MKPVRPHMPVSIQRDAALYALGLEPGRVEFHHQPPLSQRPIIDGRWQPDANDPRYIMPMTTDAHKARTPGDITVAAKVKRIARTAEQHQIVMLAKGTGGDLRDVKRHRISSRGFDKRHHPFRKFRP